MNGHVDAVDPDDARRRAAAHVLVGDADLDGSIVVLPDDVEHHLRRVMRLRDGEVVSVTDGGGRWRMAVVRAVQGTQRGAASGTIALETTSDVVRAERSAPFTIASAIPKGDRVDWLVQKASELGVDAVVLLHADRSSTTWKPERAEKQIARLQRIADEAMRQSRRVWRTTVSGPRDARDVLPRAAIAEPGAAPMSGHESVVAIGPEGGWSPDEILTAQKSIGLGANILRIETAVVVASTLRTVADH